MKQVNQFPFRFARKLFPGTKVVPFTPTDIWNLKKRTFRVVAYPSVKFPLWSGNRKISHGIIYGPSPTRRASASVGNHVSVFEKFRFGYNEDKPSPVSKKVRPARRTKFRQEFTMPPGVHVNWFPGHMAKSLRQLKKQFIPRSHMILEVRDCRVPLTSVNNQLEDIITGDCFLSADNDLIVFMPFLDRTRRSLTRI